MYEVTAYSVTVTADGTDQDGIKYTNKRHWLCGSVIQLGVEDAKSLLMADVIKIHDPDEAAKQRAETGEKGQRSLTPAEKEFLAAEQRLGEEKLAGEKAAAERDAALARAAEVDKLVAEHSQSAPQVPARRATHTK